MFYVHFSDPDDNTWLVQEIEVTIKGKTLFAFPKQDGSTISTAKEQDYGF